MKLEFGDFRVKHSIGARKIFSYVPALLQLLQSVRTCTRLAENWLDGEIGPTSDFHKQMIRAELTEIYDADELADVWEELEAKQTLDNPGLAKLVLEHGASSKAFMDALMVAPSTRILRTALGLDVWGEPIPESDRFGQMMRLVPTFAGLHYRYNLLARKILPGSQNVAILACGDMLEIELMLQLGMKLPERIIACDNSPEVAWWRMPHTEHANIDFRHEDLFPVLRSLPNASQDRILANGVCSYYIGRLDELIELAFYKLKPGGSLVTDLQIAGPHMRFNTYVLGWAKNNFYLEPTITDTVATMLSATAGLPCARFTPYVHSRISPFEVIFELQKSS